MSDHNLSIRKIAILIDGDNAEARALSMYLDESSKHGRVTTKRIYGDWTSPHMNKWKDSLNITAFRPIQKFAYTKNKNSTDTALIIDAMDLLHLGSADGFCIVSSDSDYTGLCHRIREHGKFVMGIGKSFTPEAFVNACEVFIYSDCVLPGRGSPSESTDPFIMSMRLNLDTEIAEDDDRKRSAGDAFTITPPRLVTEIAPHLPWSCVHRAFEMAVDPNTGVAQFSSLSNNLRRLEPLFDHRNFGFTSFRKFCDALAPFYEVIDAIRPSDGRPNYALRRSNTRGIRSPKKCRTI